MGGSEGSNQLTPPKRKNTMSVLNTTDYTFESHRFELQATCKEAAIHPSAIGRSGSSCKDTFEVSGTFCEKSKHCNLPAFSALEFKHNQITDNWQDGESLEVGKVEVFMTKAQLEATIKAAQDALDEWNNHELDECVRD
jgi:hypothetical protein